MKERGILFKGSMVRAILDGTKTQTRRIVKKIPPEGYFRPYRMVWEHDPLWGFAAYEKDAMRPSGNHPLAGKPHWGPVRCPYGVVGDRLWVRETWCGGQHGTGIQYKADWPEHDYGPRWKPSIHMFRKHSRIDMEIEDIRMERIQDITPVDALAEGASILPGTNWESRPDNQNEYVIRRFRTLWDSINAKRGYGWEKNPWVWAITFRRVRP